MTGLQFRYDGYKKPERRPEMCLFTPRYNFPYYGTYPSEKDTEKKWEEESYPKEAGGQKANSLGEERQEVKREEQKSEEFAEKEIGYREASLVTDNAQRTEKESLYLKKRAEQGGEETKKQNPLQISEMLINNLTITEANLTELRSQVEVAKNFFDDIIYKLESFTQIMEIVKANEERRLNGPQAQLASLKTSTDSVDELLELLQGPVFQKVLRQFLVGMFVRDEGGTNFYRGT